MIQLFSSTMKCDILFKNNPLKNFFYFVIVGQVQNSFILKIFYFKFQKRIWVIVREKNRWVAVYT